MLPSLVASELQQAIRAFLQAAFPMTTPGFRRPGGESMVDAFLAGNTRLFRGPYVSLGLPFRRAEGLQLPFSRIAPDFTPWLHQFKAFERLCGLNPQSALVATGTGSGKTECFLLPILDHCAGTNSNGIKAVIIYPMNALATDQSRRFAREVFSHSATRGKIRVGLYVGDSESSPHKQMSDENIITCKETLRANPPDILLTNYRMLDFLLMRPGDQPLWQHNDADQLKFLVVDELHSFDGAQGTDLACLIRRIRKRLVPTDGLACVGTSATIGGAANARALLEYAGQIFASAFDGDALILEDRQSPAEFLNARPADLDLWPTDASPHRLSPRHAGGPLEYLQRQAELWLGEEAPHLSERDGGLASRIALGERLCRHQAVHELLESCQSVVDIAELAAAWQYRFGVDAERARALLDSLLALLSWARSTESTEQRQLPLVQARLQLWLREMNRLTAVVQPEPELVFSDDLSGEDPPFNLPVAHCRECHATGWVAVRKPDEPTLIHDLQSIYRAWFSNNPDTCLMLPTDQQLDSDVLRRLCTGCRILVSGQQTTCPECRSESLIDVAVPDMKIAGDDGVFFQNRCPSCDARNSLTLMGSQAASLASVWIGRLYASRYNDHHKLIAFSDSVQDAAHRAGFFGARTYSDTVRAALVDLIEAEGEGQPLSLLAERAPRFWRERLGSAEDFVATFIAPNMTWLRDYEALQASDNDRLPAGSKLPGLVAKRLEWEVYQAFGLRARIGRTLERQGLASVGLTRGKLGQVSVQLHQCWREEIGQLAELELDQVRRFLVGLMWRLRTQGAFYHVFLDELIKARGKPYVLTFSHFMPFYGMGVRPPALITLESMSQYFSALHQQKGSWFYQWFAKQIAVDGAVLATAEYRQAMTLLVDRLTRAGLLIEKRVGDQSVWGLSAEDWLLTRHVQALSCGSCGHRVQVPAADLVHWIDLGCLRNTCSGAYRIPSEPPRTEAVRRGLPRRLVPAEHTGLLDADTRLAVEQSFMQGKRICTTGIRGQHCGGRKPYVYSSSDQ